MNFKFLIITLVSVSFLFSCKDKKTRTDSGYDFRFVTRGSGEEAKEDTYVYFTCLLYTSDAADERSSVDLGGRRIIKKKNKV